VVTFLAGQIPTAAMLQALADMFKKDSLDWTPSWTEVSGFETNEGWYLNVGNIYFGSWRTEFNASASISGIARITLPAAMEAGGGSSVQWCAGFWGFRDTSGGKHYSGTLGIWSSTGLDVSFCGCWDPGTSAPETRITTGKPFTVADGDVLSGGFMYLNG